MTNLRKLGRQRGFTLVELMVVISILLILVSFAVPMYQQSVLKAREAVLRQDLFAMRAAIDAFTVDKERAPQSLEEMVEAGYLKMIPKDPITSAADTWQVIQEDVMLSIDQTQPGITDVKSGAQTVGSDGTPYNEW